MREQVLVRMTRLGRAAKVVGLSIGLPILALSLFERGTGFIPSALLGWTVRGTLLGVLVVLWYRRSDYVMWPLFVTSLAVYIVIWQAAPGMGFPTQFSYAASIDQIIGFGELPTVRLQSLLYHGSPGILDQAAIAVYTSFFILPNIALLGLWRADRRLACGVARAIVLVGFLSLVPIVLFPTAPPWMASEHDAIGSVTRIAEVMIGSAAHEQAGAAVGVNEVAAMPSVHTAISVTLALALGRLVPALRRWALVYPLAMGFSLTYMGEHYVVDVLAGALVAMYAWSLAHQRWWALPRPSWRLKPKAFEEQGAVQELPTAS